MLQYLPHYRKLRPFRTHPSSSSKPSIGPTDLLSRSRRTHPISETLGDRDDLLHPPRLFAVWSKLDGVPFLGSLCPSARCLQAFGGRSTKKVYRTGHVTEGGDIHSLVMCSGHPRRIRRELPSLTPIAFFVTECPNLPCDIQSLSTADAAVRPGPELFVQCDYFRQPPVGLL